MRRTFHLLFLVFYVASSYAISQERIRLIVSELEHSSSHDVQTQVDTGCKQLRNGFPNYQRAKPKTICSLCFGENQPVCLSELSEPFFQRQTDPYVLHSDRESVLSRAPPFQS